MALTAALPVDTMAETTCTPVLIEDAIAMSSQRFGGSGPNLPGSSHRRP